MEDRQGRINLLLADLAPAERDHLKRAVRVIAAQSIGSPEPDDVHEHSGGRSKLHAGRS